MLQSSLGLHGPLTTESFFCFNGRTRANSTSMKVCACQWLTNLAENMHLVVICFDVYCFCFSKAKTTIQKTYICIFCFYYLAMAVVGAFSFAI